MLPTSSCGTQLSPTAIGHTGFTGTSLWIDWERDLYVVLLTNRVHPTRANEAIQKSAAAACTTRSSPSSGQPGSGTRAVQASSKTFDRLYHEESCSEP